MKIIKITSPLALGLLLLAGCASGPQWIGTPTQASASNSTFSATLTPSCTGYGCPGFLLSIKNNTNQNLELDWNKTLYIYAGQTSGGFMFEGVLYRDRNNQKAPDIVFANGTLQKRIYPNNLVEFSSVAGIGWYSKAMPQGENGAYLTIVASGEEINEKLLVNLHPGQ